MRRGRRRRCGRRSGRRLRAGPGRIGRHVGRKVLGLGVGRRLVLGRERVAPWIGHRDRTLSARCNDPIPAPTAMSTRRMSGSDAGVGRSVPRLAPARTISPMLRAISSAEIGRALAAPKHAQGTRTPARRRPMRNVVKKARVASAAMAPAGGTMSSSTTIENSTMGMNRAKNAGRGTPSAVKSRSVASGLRNFAIAAMAKITANATAAAYPRPEPLTRPLWSDLGS